MLTDGGVDGLGSVGDGGGEITGLVLPLDIPCAS